MTNPPAQGQDHPGHEALLDPPADHGEQSYRGSGRLEGKATVITGADSGIGRAVAIAFAREGADVVLGYLPAEEDDARTTARWVEEAGRRAVLVPGDLAEPDQCRALVARAVDALGRIDVLVNNAAFQMVRDSLEDVPDEEWDHTMAVNLGSLFHVTKAALPHLRPGASIINTTSVNSDQPPPGLIVYDTTKAGIANFTGALAQQYGPKGIRANSVAPGPIWTPLIPATMKPEDVEGFGTSTPLGRPGQPAELAPVYVMLASDESSYVSGARIAVTGGTPIL
ncbi:SDR family oxidoreductase [Actinomycetospora sp. NBRC 106378]|jgi:NAD(P)-dependent dehydrogenase (short-subunit alcohol dehydrogenase family)|uniref:SDR family oxidoreductase n=1 Tax=Actinomycetospora sp. NBRC 106378 TaxID=3032208 RepID=UPI0024A48C06|nr:SDR family oxidoreductase [Actinomycetospora sp. NBRC 106378]GLZ55448.1 oxidoreductase [Actinomycetospora sp. NBRC 106378]